MSVVDFRGVEFLLGDGDILKAPLRAYSDEAMAFIPDFVVRLSRRPDIRAWPDVAALAFWGRRGNLAHLKAGYPEAGRRLGRGLCFHIAPGNIPVNFAFTWLFGVLAGCANLVRIPSRDFPQTQILLEAIRETLTDHPEIARRTAFVRYPVDQAITARLSAVADARMIWGGDRTIAAIRALPAPPRCVDLCFSDRYSLCILDGAAVLEADEGTLKRLAERFYNDTWLMDQNACSSPQVVLWLHNSPDARERFWEAAWTIAEKKYHLPAALSVEKYAQACRDAIERAGRLGELTRRGNLLYRAELLSLEKGLEQYRGRGGYFYEYSLESLNELASVVTEKYQTVTCFGIEPETVRQWVVKSGLRGVDRVVPVGRALDISVVWDGFDIVRTLSRVVSAG